MIQKELSDDESEEFDDDSDDELLKDFDDESTSFSGGSTEVLRSCPPYEWSCPREAVSGST